MQALFKNFSEVLDGGNDSLTGISSKSSLVKGGMELASGNFLAGGFDIIKSIPGFTDFIANGFNFGCLGNSSFSNEDYKKNMEDRQYWFKSVTQSGDVAKISHFRDQLDEEIVFLNNDIPKLKNSCSIKRETAYRENIKALKSALENVLAGSEDAKNFTLPNDFNPKSSVTVTSENSASHVEDNDGEVYAPKATDGAEASASSGDKMAFAKAIISKLSPEIQAVLTANLNSLASASGMDAATATNTLVDGIFDGSIHIGSDGKITGWNVSAGSGQQTPVNTYLLYGVGALLLWKLFKSK